MTIKFTPGRWYSSKEQVCAAYGECRRGILLGKKDDIAVIFKFLGARRTHCGDEFDIENRRIMYVGAGKTGDQKENPGNLALIDAEKSGKPIRVFLDCGNLFSPKKLLYAGEWHVRGKEYVPVDGRRVYRFRLEPEDQATVEQLVFTFGTLGTGANFELDLKNYAAVRQRLYAQHGAIVRSMENIAGEIGKYFAIKMFNLKYPAHPLIRLSGSHKDADAIQMGTGKRFAIKTIGKFPSVTSNLWSKNIDEIADAFLVTHLDCDLLEPILVFIVTASQAAPFLKRDQVQGCRKLRVDDKLIRISKTIFASG